MDKEIRWVGSSYDDLLSFPIEARRQAGFQKSSQATSVHDKRVAEARYRAIVNARKGNHP